MEPLLLTIPDCCRLAAIGRSSVYKLIRQGRLPIRKIGRRTLIAATDLQEFVQRLGVGSCDVSGKPRP
jgi:excisionase family DNA binding protein